MIKLTPEILQLNDKLFIGHGYHKNCYHHPFDKSLCIKLAYNEEGQKDLSRELKYLAVLKKKDKDYSVLPKYYGPVQTNLGLGHVYELLEDYDGQKSKTLKDYLTDASLLKANLPMLITELKKLKTTLIDNEILTMGIASENILFQRKNPADKLPSLRVINDMGSPALIPLEYHFSCFAKAKVKRHWQRFMKHILKICSFPEAKKLVENIA